MIKSFLLNNLLAPLQQVSPQMLLASAALHGLLFTVPIPSNSTDVASSKDAANVSEPGMNEPLYNQDGSILEEPGMNSLGEGNPVTIPGEPPLIGSENGTLPNPDSALNEPGGSLNEPGVSLNEPGISSNEPGISSNEPGVSLNEPGSNGVSFPELPAESNNTSLGEPQPQTNFTPSEPVNLLPEPTVTEPQLPNIVSEPTVTEPQLPNIVSEPTVTEPQLPNTVPEPTVTEPQLPNTVPEPTVTEPDTNKTTESKPDETPQTNNPTKQSPVNPFDNFPNYISVKPNFCGLQSAKIDRRTRITSDPLDAVQAYFEKKFADTDFQVEKLIDEPDTKVYQVSKENLTQFLQLFAAKESGTMILLSPQRVDCYRLGNQNPQEKPKTEQAFDATFSNLYAQLNWTEEKDFAPTSEVEKVLGKDTKNTPEQLALLVKTKLESEGFEASQIENNETSELLYEVKKGEFIKYISFVPTEEGKAAIVLVLKNPPS